jgi:hypothetical protein
MMGSVTLFMHFTGLSWASKLHTESATLLLVFMFALFIPLPIGLALGGWLWFRIAKRFLGITRGDMEAELLSERFRVKFLDRANRRAIERLYGTDEHG